MTEQNIAIITGAVGNLGRATAQAFQRGGYKSVLVDRSQDRLNRTFADLVSSPDHLLIGGVDLSSPV